jgi:hypothetical protein
VLGESTRSSCGYLPVTTYSCHYFSDPGFAAAIGNFLACETAQVFHINSFNQLVKLFEKSAVKRPHAILFYSLLCMPDNLFLIHIYNPAR